MQVAKRHPDKRATIALRALLSAHSSKFNHVVFNCLPSYTYATKDVISGPYGTETCAGPLPAHPPAPGMYALHRPFGPDADNIPSQS
jgi:hypothetical protein